MFKRYKLGYVSLFTVAICVLMASTMASTSDLYSSNNGDQVYSQHGYDTSDDVSPNAVIKAIAVGAFSNTITPRQSMLVNNTSCASCHTPVSQHDQQMYYHVPRSNLTGIRTSPFRTHGVDATVVNKKKPDNVIAPGIVPRDNKPNSVVSMSPFRISNVRT